MLDANAVADGRVVDLGKWADPAVLANRRIPAQDGKRLEHCVAPYPDARVHVRRCWIHHGDARMHQVVEEPFAQSRLGPGQLHTVIHPDRLAGVGDPQHLGRAQVPEDVGKVQFRRLVVRSQPAQCLQQPLAVETVQSDVDLSEGTDVLSGVLEFDDPIQCPVRPSHDAAVPPVGVFDTGKGGRQTRSAVDVKQPPNGLAPYERQIAVDHEHVAPPEPVRSYLGNRMTGTQLLRLEYDLVGAFRLVLEVSGDSLVLGRDHHGNVFDPCVAAGAQYQVDHGPSAEPVQDLGAARMQTRAQPGG